MRTEKPWGYEDLIFQGHGYAVKKIRLNFQMATSLHYHEIKHETIMVLSGVLRIKLIEDEIPKEITLCPGDSRAIEPGVVHQMSTQSQDTEYFEAQTDFLTDVIRISDPSGRVSNN
jgi:mannose-6-phosphate isomerase-like protein (cupin superfamily)